MSAKRVFRSDRKDVKVLDEMYAAMDRLYLRSEQVRVLRFYCSSQGITWQDLFPEAKA